MKIILLTIITVFGYNVIKKEGVNYVEKNIRGKEYVII